MNVEPTTIEPTIETSTAETSIADTGTSQPAVTGDEATDVAPGPTRTTTNRTMSVAWLWTLFGLAGAYGGGAFAIPLTTPHVEASTDDFAGLLYLVTVPLGFVVGTIVAMLVARSVERDSPSQDNLFTRTELAFMGVLLPILVAVAGSFIAGVAGNYLG